MKNQNYIKKLKIIFSFAIIFIIIFGNTAFALGPDEAVSDEQLSNTKAPDITAETAVLMDGMSGQILYGKDIHKQMYPASITKILTGLVAVQNGHPDDMIIVSDNAVKCENGGVANVGMRSGEQFRQSDVLYAMFLASANEAAVVLAEHIGGTVDNFTAMMNNTAKKLGAVDSHFNNPNGLPDKNNVTSAYDMALITKKATETPELMKYFGAKTYVIAPTNKYPQVRNLYTLDKMMKDTRYQYDGVVAGKTGWETMSGHTLVTVAQRNGMQLICVVMKSSNATTVYTDTSALLDYGFKSFKQVTVKLSNTTNHIQNNGVDLNNIVVQKHNELTDYILTVAFVSICLLIIIISSIVKYKNYNKEAA